MVLCNRQMSMARIRFELGGMEQSWLGNHDQYTRPGECAQSGLPTLPSLRSRPVADFHLRTRRLQQTLTLSDTLGPIIDSIHTTPDNHGSQFELHAITTTPGLRACYDPQVVTERGMMLVTAILFCFAAGLWPK